MIPEKAREALLAYLVTDVRLYTRRLEEAQTEIEKARIEGVLEGLALAKAIIEDN